jgi:broad specificity phosphatase PhoE
MDSAAADTTQDWLLPGHSRPPLIGELEQRIETALATARSSEAAVMTIGAAALDAAEQARHAAELAERASTAALDAQDRVARLVIPLAPERKPAPPHEPEAGGESLRDFSERADRLVARLRQLQRVPLAAPAASDASGRPQSAR